MAIMAMGTVSKNKTIILCSALLFSQSAFSGDLQFTPSIKIDETYTDNVELTTNNKISSLVSQTAFLLDSSYQAQYATFNFHSESIYALYSHDHEKDDDFHTLDADFAIQLWPNGISFIGSAKLDRRSKNSARNSLADIVSGDTVEVQTYTSGFGYIIENSLFLINSKLNYHFTESEDDIGNREGYIGSFLSKNGSSAKNIFWDTSASYQENKNNGQDSKMYRGEIKLGYITPYDFNPFLRYYDEDNSGSINSGQSKESNSYGLGVRWLITPRFYLDVSYNKPIGTQLDIDGKTQKEYVDASINWQPSIRTQLEASFSQRFYGDSYGLNLTHENKRLTNSISYIEDVQSFTRNNYIAKSLGSFWCPNEDSPSGTNPDQETTDLTNCYAQGDSNIDFDNYHLIGLNEFELIEDDQFSLNKALNWTSSLALSRTTFTLTLTASTRENLETHIEDNNDAAKFSIKRKVSGRSNIALNFSYTDNQLQKKSENERRDRYRQYAINYDKSLNSELKADFSLAYVNRSSKQQQFNYKEGRVTFKITKGF